MLSLGIDIVDINRINKILKRDDSSFLNKVFTRKEILRSGDFVSTAEYFSKLFSFKESFAKAKGCGFTDSLRPKDIELIFTANDQKKLIFPSKYIKAYFKNKKIRDLHSLEFFTKENNIICKIVLYES